MSTTTQALRREPDKATLRKAIAASAIGNATEWFDYGVYAVAVTYITINFFPSETGTGTVWALATFALSFLVRPLGGMFWGPLGDKFGRKKVLALTILLMAGATFAVGILPTFDQIGVLAPALLILLRMVQGFSTGGEYGGAATFMAEYAPDKKRGFYGSFLEFGTLGGFALGALIVLAATLGLGQETMAEWGWRIPFLIAGPMGLIGLYLRSKIEDTPVFQEQEEAAAKAEKENKRGVWRELFTHYRKAMLIMAGLVIALNVVNYTLLSYMPTYLEHSINLSPETSLMVVLIGYLGMMCLVPFFGSLSDRVGRKPLWIFSLVSLMVLVIPLYMLMGQGFGWAIVAFVVLGLLYIPQLATISATFPAFFPTHVRYAGFAITYNVATALFGGTAPMANEALIESTGFRLMPAVYMIVACAIGLIAALMMKETSGVSIRTQPVSIVAAGERIKAPGE
ncbi:MFS transporter [Leucobacter celer]|jgi:MHS family proline/betaine transporter-like MFS transporter|uniref:MFS transporter n=1 Tax=Leucobacter celer TaxID=668625 RepID=UPI0006A7D7EC|nr:MFS transporter [Leucobacter celer]